MTEVKYREILRLKDLGISERNIALSCNISRNTVSKVLKKSDELNVTWKNSGAKTEAEVRNLLFPREETHSGKRLPDYEYVRKELLKNGVNKKLLWAEYCEDCKLNGEEPLMYSRFCYYLQEDEEKHRATMHIPRKPGEQIEVDWAGDPATITNPFTGEITKVPVFVGVLNYSQYPYVEAFKDMQEASWIAAHVHMYEYFGGVSTILVPDNCSTAVVHTNDWYDQKLNRTYRDMAEHYGTAIIPARVRKPKDKPSAEGTVGHISTWIIAALRNEQFFSLGELNKAIREKLNELIEKPFQKREGSRKSLFLGEEKPYLAPLPATRFELTEWRTATVQFNYHIAVDYMYYSVPYQYIKKKVDVKTSSSTIEIFYSNERIASHVRLYGTSGQYSTNAEHMPPDHQKFLEWNAKRFRSWANKIGPNTFKVIDALLKSREIEQQSYRSCMGILKLSEKYSEIVLETACMKALSYTPNPSYKSIKNLVVTQELIHMEVKDESEKYGLTRGAKYYGGNQNE